TASCAERKRRVKKRKKPSGLCCKKRDKKKGGELDETWQPSVSVMLSAVPLVEPDALKCQLSSCKHSTPAQTLLPQKLSLLNSCVIAGHRPRGAWWWAGGWEG
ncbi:hypothetical protein GOODEAATRI_019807, partial [Goodea atripinnis]